MKTGFIIKHSTTGKYCTGKTFSELSGVDKNFYSWAHLDAKVFSSKKDIEGYIQTLEEEMEKYNITRKETDFFLGRAEIIEVII